MVDLIHGLVERYGLVAIFLGCLAEGETAAILAGFLAHQDVFDPRLSFAVVAGGAFLGDVGLFLLGRRYANHPRVEVFREKPGFAQAHRFVLRHPDLFVLFNRFIYGMRAVGGVVAGLSGIGVPRFLMLNAVSSLAWAGIFHSLGYFVGLGAEAAIGEALARHERLLLMLAIGAVAIAGGTIAARRILRRKPQ